MIRDIFQYHEQTKHHPYRYARALGYMDWETQPDPFRRFTGAPVHRLALGSGAEGPLWNDVYDPAGQDAQALGKASVSDLFFYSLALSATKQYMDNQWYLRCNPSSGNLHPTALWPIRSLEWSAACATARTWWWSRGSRARGPR